MRILQTLFRDGSEVCSIGCENVVNNEDKQSLEITDYGCELTELSDEEIQAFKDRLSDYYEEVTAQYGEEACEAFDIEY